VILTTKTLSYNIASRKIYNQLVTLNIIQILLCYYHVFIYDICYLMIISTTCAS